MKNFNVLIRTEEWKDSKLTWVLIACGLFYLEGYTEKPHFLINTLAFTALIIIYYISVALVNDLADEKTDIIAGKHKPIHSISKHKIAVFIIGLSIAFLLLLFLLAPNPYFIAGGIIMILFGTLVYSVPPIRLKERGLAGVFCGGILLRTLPVLLLSVFMERGVLWVYSLLTFLTILGTRQMIVHQVKDIDRDIKSGVSTYSTAIGSAKASVISNKILYLLELISLGIVIFAVYKFVTNWILIIAVLYIVTWVYLFVISKKFSNSVNIQSTSCSFPADFYFIWLPLFVGVAVCIKSEDALYLIGIIILQKWHFKNFIERL